MRSSCGNSGLVPRGYRYGGRGVKMSGPDTMGRCGHGVWQGIIFTRLVLLTICRLQFSVLEYQSPDTSPNLEGFGPVALISSMFPAS